MMKISELKAGQGKVDVQCKVKSKAETRVMEKYGKELKIANAVVEDDSGEIALTLWNDDADKVVVGNMIRISNGYVSEFNGKKQLTSGKFGKLEVIKTNSGTDAGVSDSAEPEEDFEEKPAKGKKAKKNEEMDEVEF